MRRVVCLSSLAALVLAAAAPAHAAIIYGNTFNNGGVAADPGSTASGTWTLPTGTAAVSTNTRQSAAAQVNNTYQNNAITSAAGFSGNMLLNSGVWRTAGNPGALPQPVITLSLTGIGGSIATTRDVTVTFLLAIIDSWDGLGTNANEPDFFDFAVNGSNVIHHGFADDLSNSTNPPPAEIDTIIAGESLVQLGFRTTYTDSAYRVTYNLTAYDSDSLTLQWSPSGTGFQGGNYRLSAGQPTNFLGTQWDEAFAIENLVIDAVDTPSPPTAVPEPSTLLLGCLGGLGLGLLRLRKRNPSGSAAETC